MSRILEGCITDLRSRANLRTVVEKVVSLKGHGDDLVGLCPFHSEKTPSFHVHPERGFFKCFGCGKSGDAIDFVAESENLSFTNAVEALGARFGVVINYEDGTQGSGSAAGGVVMKAAPRPIPTRAPSPTWLKLQPTLHRGTLSELSHLADLRQLPAIAGLELATRADQLFFADVFDDGYTWPAWIVTDASRRNAQARRMDGQPWSGIGGKKAKTIQGCEANWPVGIANIQAKGIALVEGGPDFLAAWHFVWVRERVGKIQPVAMFGAAHEIHPEAQPLFASREVWVFPHADDAGATGAMKWKSTIEQAGANFVQFWDFKPYGVKDLNELIAVEHARDFADV